MAATEPFTVHAQLSHQDVIRADLACAVRLVSALAAGESDLAGALAIELESECLRRLVDLDHAADGASGGRS
jgi:hypothetical protein